MSSTKPRVLSGRFKDSFLVQLCLDRDWACIMGMWSPPNDHVSQVVSGCSALAPFTFLQGAISIGDIFVELVILLFKV